MKSILLTAAALALVSAPALAQEPAARVTGSVGYTQLEGDDASLGTVTARGAYNINRYVGVEGEASVGVKDDDVVFGGVNTKLEHEYDLAGYVVGTLPISPNFELFGRVGYGTTEVKASTAGFAATEDGNSVNYGVGANYFFDGKNGVRADWTRRDFQEDQGGELDTYGVGYVRRF